MSAFRTRLQIVCCVAMVIVPKRAFPSPRMPGGKPSHFETSVSHCSIRAVLCTTTITG